MTEWTSDDRPFPTLPVHGYRLSVAKHGFLMLGPDGLISPTLPQGVVMGQHRALSKLNISLNGSLPSSVEAEYLPDGTDCFIYKFANDFELTVAFRLNSSEEIEGEVAAELALDCSLNCDNPSADAVLRFEFAADFIDVLKVRDPSTVVAWPELITNANADSLSYYTPKFERWTAIKGEGWTFDEHGAQIVIEAQTAELLVAFGSGELQIDSPRPTHVKNHQPVLSFHSDNKQLNAWMARSTADISLLTLHNGVLGAGLPWFFTPFTRDSCISILLMGRLANPTSVKGTLFLLAAHQGTHYNAITNEEPGRLPHEVVLIGVPSLSMSKGEADYFSIDATPLWLLTVASCHQWGLLNDDDIELLRPSINAAIDWIKDAINKGGGVVRYKRSGDVGLVNQGWKDSYGAIVFADGSIASGEIALIEVQCYAESALRLIAPLVEPSLAKECIAIADELRIKINNDFWCEDTEGKYLAMGINGDNSLIDGVGSNAAHGLWTGSYEQKTAEIVTAQLTRSSMWTEWGLRTLSSSSPAFDIDAPTSYHLGPVWPHETAILAEGWFRYGMYDLADKAVNANLAAVGKLTGGRLPEVHAGVLDETTGTVRILPRSCIVQLWATASAFAAFNVTQRARTGPVALH